MFVLLSFAVSSSLNDMAVVGRGRTTLSHIHETAEMTPHNHINHFESTKQLESERETTQPLQSLQAPAAMLSENDNKRPTLRQHSKRTFIPSNNASHMRDFDVNDHLPLPLPHKPTTPHRIDIVLIGFDSHTTISKRIQQQHMCPHRHKSPQPHCTRQFAESHFQQFRRFPHRPTHCSSPHSRTTSRMSENV